MGFGSYDESDQRDPEIASGDGDKEDVELHKHDYEGSMSFESGGSTDDLVEGLANIMEDAEEDEEEEA